ncbi:MAG: thiamine-monophosphate kinase [Blastocatellia bacterium]|jgi:thiamine-monophosphate kinase|nr:thiamine-monophosphate kinase [Blastocatellia bacterium]
MSEFDFIDRIRRLAKDRFAGASALSLGIGDDAAVIQPRPGVDTVVTTDLLVEDIDFRREMPARLLGQKALAVSLSDIAAMGARPRWSFISLGLPEEIWKSDFVDEFYEGFFALADHYSVTLAGGDISRAPERIIIDSVVVGEVQIGQAVKRSDAHPGDSIFVTGTLGGAAAGLRLIETGAQLHVAADREHELAAVDALLLRQMCPEPRVGWGRVLGEERLASAMIDVSDGLSSDLRHLCHESGAGALIQSSAIPLDPHAVELCGRRALDPLLLALHGGEDFELLFTVRPDSVGGLPRQVDGVPITKIGQITAESESIRIAEGNRVWDLPAGGFEHFKAHN